MSNPTSSTAAKDEALVASATEVSEEEEPASPTADDSLFSTPSSLTDVVLVVEGKKLHVSQALLCLTSSVFLKMFEGDFKNKTEVPIADKKYADFVEFLLCVHPSTSKPVQRKTLDIVLPLADVYKVESLKQRCEQFVLNMFQLKDTQLSDPSNVELVHFLFLSDKYNLSALLDVCVGMAQYRTYAGEHGIKTLREFSVLSADTKFQILSGRMISLEAPLTRLRAYKQSLHYIVDPYCSACLRQGHNHTSPGCREQLRSNLSADIDKLTTYFKKDPRYDPKQAVKDAK